MVDQEGRFEVKADHRHQAMLLPLFVFPAPRNRSGGLACQTPNRASNSSIDAQSTNLRPPTRTVLRSPAAINS